MARFNTTGLFSPFFHVLSRYDKDRRIGHRELALTLRRYAPMGGSFASVRVETFSGILTAELVFDTN